MSVYREKKENKEKRPRDLSISRKLKRTESTDRRPIITQEKMSTSKQSSASLKEKKSQREKITSEKLENRKPDGREDTKKSVVKDKKSTKQNVGPVRVKRHDSVEPRTERESRLDAKYLKSLLDKKEIRKSETERSTKEKINEKSLKSFYGAEAVRRQEEEERKVKPRRDRTRTRTLSPTEIKQLIPSSTTYELASGDLNATMEETEKDRRKKEETEEEGGGDAEYEDDFEDYDSDFEKYDETELQESSNSHTSLASSLESQTREPVEVKDRWKLIIRKKEIDAVKKSIEKENNDLLERRKSISQTLGDDSDKENILVKKPASSTVVECSNVFRKQKKAKVAAANRKRGEELLNMISLDTISYSILEIPPIPYEEFMKLFGRSNTKQIYVQTNEDDLDEEIQTDEIQISNKWTQNPPDFLGRKKPNNNAAFVLTKEERLGVGGDSPMEEEITIHQKSNALWNFLSWASQTVLIELEKKSGNFLSLENMPNHSKAMAFGDGFVSLNINNIPFLKGRSVTHLCLLSKSIKRLLSVHTNKEKLFQKCMICIWSLRELSKPLKILMAFNRVTSSCFGLNQGNLVFAGLCDGSICLWDLREPSALHNRMTSSSEWSLQSPTYTTSGSVSDSGHTSPVVAVRLLNKTEESSKFKDFTPMQICSLDKEGTIVIWTVVQLEKAQKSVPSDDVGLAHWGRVKLIKSSSFSVFASLREEISGLYITCNDILINEAEDDGFYVANSLGSVHHCSSYGFPMKPKFYVPSKQDAIIETTCLELCPFNGNYFLVGCEDGTIRLHSRHQENPLICLSSNFLGNEREAPVVSLSWMPMRPCVFFALDSMSRINIWDLKVSDIYPEISLVLTEKKITSMRLLSVSNPHQVPFIVIGTEGGSIEIHKLKREYGCRTASDVQNEMKMFLKYLQHVKHPSAANAPYVS